LKTQLAVRFNNFVSFWLSENESSSSKSSSRTKGGMSFVTEVILKRPHVRRSGTRELHLKL